MNTAASIQSNPVKHFSVGLAIGVSSDIITSLVLSIFPAVIETMFFDTFVGNNTNMFALGVLSFFIHLSLFVVLIVLVQKKMKNKLTTIGTASGLVGSMLLMAMMIPLFIK